MLDKTLDKLLAIHFDVEPDYSKLDMLEKDVWRRIRMQATDVAMPWYDKMLMAFSVPQFRVASVVMAMVIGLSIGQITITEPTYKPMGLHMFSANAPYLPSTLLTKTK